jgi:hypothetical protein
LQEPLGLADGQTAADDQSKKICAHDSKDTANRRSDQAAKVYAAQLPLKKNDGKADARSYRGIKTCFQAKRTDKKTGNRDN